MISNSPAIYNRFSDRGVGMNLNSALRISEASPPQPPTAVKVVCREIQANDANGVIQLLTRGFSPARDRQFWKLSLERMQSHQVPVGYPRYGYILEAGGIPVGIILLIFTSIENGIDPAYIQCSVSSWYVDPEFRAFGTLLVACALKHKHVIYYNLTPAPHTWDILVAQGYRRFSTGRMTCVPVLSNNSWGCRVECVRKAAVHGGGLSQFELNLLKTHVDYGCLSLVCTASDGSRYPFVFSVRRRLGVVRFGFLIYCRDVESFVRFSGAIGRYLIMSGISLVMIDALDRIPALVGRYSAVNPKYYKGPRAPRLGDLSFSDRAMFGV
jgi:hypothetical protein